MEFCVEIVYALEGISLSKVRMANMPSKFNESPTNLHLRCAKPSNWILWRKVKQVPRFLAISDVSRFLVRYDVPRFLVRYDVPRFLVISTLNKIQDFVV